MRCESRREARERRRGEIPAKAFASGPERGKPKGATSGWHTKHMLAVRDSCEGQNPGTAARRAGPTASADGNQRRVKRYVGPSGPDNGSGTLREEKAPKGESQERCRCEIKPARVTKGVSRQEGSQTLKAERGGQANARDQRTFEPSSAVGTESPREVLIRRGGSARCDWVTLSREAKLDEWISLCCLTVASVVRAGKTTQPRVGPTAQWDRQTSSGDT